MNPTPKPGEIYTHYKDPNKKYEIIGIAFHTEMEEEVVIYKPLYENSHAYFVRPLAMFIENIEKDGVEQPRFKLVK